ncbi:MULTISPECIES: histidine kinase [unclassified Pseudonocardia]|uniref:sensor histidine kinase n=1 Tax=unclassified Pseudonocardia TaxID=2619320 RepID=UPI001AC75876|nr:MULTISPECIES: histidine kinase [unclassified Pseudonocardia]MBN9103226.1 sensor histidine kinase [Pseudonocardia sp.]
MNWTAALHRGGVELAAVGIPVGAVLLSHPPFTWSLTAGLVACLVLPLRHLWPPLAVLGGLWGLAGGLGWPAAVVSLYALGRRNGRVWGTLPWLVLPVVAAVTPVLVTQDLSWQQIVLTVAYVGINAVAPAFVGLLMATRTRLTASLRELEQVREDALAASQDAARAQERARIGREIHDAVGHHATLIAVGAAALAASTQEEPTREAAERIRGLAKRALAEMRVALGLADGGAEQRAGLAEMAALVAGAQAAGVDVEITHHGARTEVAPGVGRAVYRVVQESLTNAVRHAAGASVRVDLTWHPDELYVQVVNAAPARRRRVAFAAGGAGLSGLVERVTSVGGELSAGTSAGGGFAVRATFPLVAAAPPIPAQASV